MKHTSTDYLFALSLYEEAIPLSRLLFHLETDGGAGREAYLRAKQDLRTLEREGLVALSTQNGADCARLTELGRQTADAAASAMADRMVREWQYRSMPFRPPCGQPA